MGKLDVSRYYAQSKIAVVQTSKADLTELLKKILFAEIAVEASNYAQSSISAMHENSVPNIISTFEDTIFNKFAASVLNIMRLSGLFTARAVDAINAAVQLKQKIFADIAAKAFRFALLSLISTNAPSKLAVVQTSVDDLTAMTTPPFSNSGIADAVATI